jgi:hypothetical protein
MSTASFPPEQLARLLVALFPEDDELRRMLGYWPAGRPIARDVAVDAPSAELARSAVQVMIDHGLVDAFFLLLQEKRPLRRDEIDTLHRHWLRARGDDITVALAPLPLSPEMERIQLFAEGEETVAHNDTTPLHLLHALLAVHAAYDVQARLCSRIDPDTLLRALKSLARAEGEGVPEETRITREGYERLWAQAHEVARRRDGLKLQYPDMLMAICTLRPVAIGDYLQAIGVAWDEFDAMVFQPTPSAYGTESERVAYYREVYEQLIDLKKAYGERVDNWSIEKFVVKLRDNTAELMKRPEAVDVRFVPYIKDGKVGLRATVVRA